MNKYLTNQTHTLLFELQLCNEDLAVETNNSRIIKLEYLKNQKIQDLRATYNLLELNKSSFIKDVINTELVSDELNYLHKDRKSVV